MPKISVIMPAYNAEKYIKKAIDSILEQTFGDFELIILNDASKDASEQIILSYTDARIVYVKNEKNLGVAGTLNRGLEMVRGEYIARMDADDIALPDRLKKQAALLDGDPSLVACGTQLESFCDDAEIATGFHFPVTKEEAGAMLVLHPSVAHPTVMMRASVLQQNNLNYDLRYEGTEDFALWWELSKYGTIVSMNEVLLRYRIHAAQATKTASPERIAVFRKFAAKRLEDLGVSTEMADALFDYTCNTYCPATQQEVKAFIAMLKEILTSKIALSRFDGKAMQKLLCTCAMRSIHMAVISEKERAAVYKYAKAEGLFNRKAWFMDKLRRMVRRIR